MSTFNTCCKLCCFELWWVTSNSFLELSTHFYRAMAQHPYVIFLLVSEDGAQNIMRNIPRHTDPPQIQPMTSPKKADLSWSWQKYFPEGYFTSYIIYLYLALWTPIVDEENDHIEMNWGARRDLCLTEIPLFLFYQEMDGKRGKLIYWKTPFFSDSVSYNCLGLIFFEIIPRFSHACSSWSLIHSIHGSSDLQSTILKKIPSVRKVSAIRKRFKPI